MRSEIIKIILLWIFFFVIKIPTDHKNCRYDGCARERGERGGTTKTRWNYDFDLCFRMQIKGGVRKRRVRLCMNTTECAAIKKKKKLLHLISPNLAPSLDRKLFKIFFPRLPSSSSLSSHTLSLRPSICIYITFSGYSACLMSTFRNIIGCRGFLMPTASSYGSSIIIAKQTDV